MYRAYKLFFIYKDIQEFAYYHFNNLIRTKTLITKNREISGRWVNYGQIPKLLANEIYYMIREMHTHISQIFYFK